MCSGVGCPLCRRKEIAASRWDPSRLQEMARLIGHTAMVTSLAVHPAFLRPNLVFAGSKDRTIRVFDITTASRLCSAKFEAIYTTTDGKSEMEYDSRMAYVLIKASKMILATSRSILQASWR